MPAHIPGQQETGIYNHGYTSHITLKLFVILHYLLRYNEKPGKEVMKEDLKSWITKHFDNIFKKSFHSQE